jgi:hypothetical protein
VKARVAILLEHDDVPSAAREQRRDRRTRRAAADHEDVAGGVGGRWGGGQPGPRRPTERRGIYHTDLGTGARVARLQ